MGLEKDTKHQWIKKLEDKKVGCNKKTSNKHVQSQKGGEKETQERSQTDGTRRPRNPQKKAKGGGKKNFNALEEVYAVRRVDYRTGRREASTDDRGEETE